MKSLRMSKPNGYGSDAAVFAEKELVNSKDEAAALRLKLSMPAKGVKENVLHETGQLRSPGAVSQDRKQDAKNKDTGKGATRFENTLFGSMKGKKK